MVTKQGQRRIHTQLTLFTRHFTSNLNRARPQNFALHNRIVDTPHSYVPNLPALSRHRHTTNGHANPNQHTSLVNSSTRFQFFLRRTLRNRRGVTPINQMSPANTRSRVLTLRHTSHLFTHRFTFTMSTRQIKHIILNMKHKFTTIRRMVNKMIGRQSTRLGHLFNRGPQHTNVSHGHRLQLAFHLISNYIYNNISSRIQTGTLRLLTSLLKLHRIRLFTARRSRLTRITRVPLRFLQSLPILTISRSFRKGESTSDELLPF